ncbi:unnamed protein product [Boreogadus saida]
MNEVEGLRLRRLNRPQVITDDLHMPQSKGSSLLVAWCVVAVSPRYADTLHPSPSLEGTQNNRTENQGYERITESRAFLVIY